MTYVARLVLAAAIALGALGPALADTSADRETINRQAQQDFVAERFDLLEETASSYLETKAVNTDGGRRLASFYQGLKNAIRAASPAEAEAAIERGRRIVLRWLKAYPQSKPAHVMQAEIALNHAWMTIGPKPGSSVSRAQWELFALRLQATQFFLEKALPVAADDPHWHSIALAVAREFRFPDETYEKVAAKALDVDPEYSFTHSEILARTEGRWGGAREAYRAVVDDIASRTSRERGETFYALGYARLAYTYKHTFFTRTGVDWARFRQGYEDLLTQFPSVRNLNSFAAFACLHGDSALLAAMLEKIGTNLDQQYWEPTASMDVCVNSVKAAKKAAEDIAHYAQRKPPAAELVQRRRITADAAADFIAGRFDQLEATHANLLASKARTESGDWKLEYFYAGLVHNALIYPDGSRAGQPHSEKLEEQLTKWRAASPDSTVAAIASARASWQHARHLLEQFDDDEGATEGRKIKGFKLLVKARQQLEAVRAAASADPEWWAVKLAVEREDLASDKTLNALAAEALRLEPTYGRILSEIVKRAPRNPLRAFDGFVQSILATARPDRLPEIYARSYLWLAEVSRWKALINDAQPIWPILKSGLDLIVARWPSDWNLNAYANLACLAKDRSAARLVLTRLDGRIIEEQWDNWRSPKACLEQSAKAAD